MDTEFVDGTGIVHVFRRASVFHEHEGSYELWVSVVERAIKDYEKAIEYLYMNRSETRMKSHEFEAWRDIIKHNPVHFFFGRDEPLENEEALPCIDFNEICTVFGADSDAARKSIMEYGRHLAQVLANEYSVDPERLEDLYKRLNELTMRYEADGDLPSHQRGSGSGKKRRKRRASRGGSKRRRVGGIPPPVRGPDEWDWDDVEPENIMSPDDTPAYSAAKEAVARYVSSKTDVAATRGELYQLGIERYKIDAMIEEGVLRSIGRGRFILGEPGAADEAVRYLSAMSNTSPAKPTAGTKDDSFKKLRDTTIGMYSRDIFLDEDATEAARLLMERAEAYDVAAKMDEQIASARNYLDELGISERLDDSVKEGIEKAIEEVRVNIDTDEVPAWIFAELSNDSVDVLLPFQKSDEYPTLIEDLFDYCERAFAGVGDAEHSDYRGFLNLHIDVPDLGEAAKAFVALSDTPGELKEAGIVIRPSFFYPISVDGKITEKTSAPEPAREPETPEEPYRGNRGEIMRYVREHGGINTAKCSQITGLPLTKAMDLLRSLVHKNSLEHDGQNYVIPESGGGERPLKEAYPVRQTVSVDGEDVVVGRGTAAALDYLSQNGSQDGEGVHITELTEATGLTQQSILNYFKKGYLERPEPGTYRMTKIGEEIFSKVTRDQRQ